MLGFVRDFFFEFLWMVEEVVVLLMDKFLLLLVCGILIFSFFGIFEDLIIFFYFLFVMN